MYILGSGCGWIPDAPIKFMYHIINLIKNLTPVVLIIMGSLDFGKAVMSQKEDEIKKAQGAFIKKLIAGAAVFFVVVFARWVLTIIDNTGQVDTSNAFKCVSLLLKGSYSADDKKYYDDPNTNTTKPTTTEDNYINCYNNCKQYSGIAQSECLKSCKTTTTTNQREDCLVVNAKKIEECIKQNSGNTAQQFYNYDSFYNSCISSFENQGDFTNACIQLEDCMDSIYGIDNLCEELTYSSEYDKCENQFDSYNNYANKYGSYTDTFDQYNEQCHQYANKKVEEHQSGIQSNDNIESYCKNLYCKN